MHLLWGLFIAVIVQCGTSRLDKFNITYIGTASLVYSVYQELDCVAARNGKEHYLINVNNRPECGAVVSQQRTTTLPDQCQQQIGVWRSGESSTDRSVAQW